MLLVPEVANWEIVLIFFAKCVTDTCSELGCKARRRGIKSVFMLCFFSLLPFIFWYLFSVAWLSPSQERLQYNDIYCYILLSFILGRQIKCLCMFICTHTICYIPLGISFYNSVPMRKKKFIFLVMIEWFGRFYLFFDFF